MSTSSGASVPKRGRASPRRGGRPEGFEERADMDRAMAMVLRSIEATSPECVAIVAYAWVEGGSTGWVRASGSQIETATGLRRDRQSTGLRTAKDAGLLGEWVGGVPRCRHLRVNVEALLRLVQTARKSQYVEKPHTSRRKNRTQGSGKPPHKQSANQQTHASRDLSDTTDGGSICRSESSEPSAEGEACDLDARAMAVADEDVGEEAIAVAGEVGGLLREAEMWVDLERLARLAQVMCHEGRVDVLRRVVRRMARPEVAVSVRSPYPYLVASIEAEPPESKLARRVRQAAEPAGGKLAGREYLERRVGGRGREDVSARSSIDEEAVRAMIADPESDVGRIARQVAAGRLEPTALHDRISFEQTGGYDASHEYAAPADRALKDLVGEG